MSRLKNLGENIKKYREQQGLSQTNVAVKLGISYEFLGRVERGQKYMSLKKLFELADILNVKFKDLTNFD